MKPEWGKVQALFGGAFDPPHEGHLSAVEGLFKNPGVARVHIVPTGVPRFKSHSTLAAIRARMTELAFQSRSFSGPVEICEHEIQKAALHPTLPTTTFDTLLELRPKLGSCAVVVGTDQISALHQWYRFPEVLKLAHWIVLVRKPTGELPAVQTLKSWESGGLLRLTDEGLKTWSVNGTPFYIQIVETPAPEISSAELRAEMARSGNTSSFIPPSVRQYIQEQRLYAL